MSDDLTPGAFNKQLPPPVPGVLGAADYWEELHYCALVSQSNIYGLAQCKAAEENKLLVACLQAKVTCVALQNRLPAAQVLAFTYIPNDAEIVCIDAFNRYHDGLKGVVVAIAFIKPLERGKRTCYLNIYCEWETGFETDMERVSEGCQSLELAYIPYQLYHTDLYRNGRSYETVFLLSGSDKKIHLFSEAKNTHMFVRGDVDDYFPEMVDPPSIVTRMQCVYIDEKRLSVLGCQDGHVIVTITDTVRKSSQRYEVQHDSCISSVNIFQLRTDLHPPDFTQACTGDDYRGEADCPTGEFHVLVASSLEPAVVYARVLTHGISDAYVLPESDAADCVTCSIVADVDFDGVNEIIVGTYGQELLVYKFQPRAWKSSNSKTFNSAPAEPSGECINISSSVTEHSDKEAVSDANPPDCTEEAATLDTSAADCTKEVTPVTSTLDSAKVALPDESVSDSNPTNPTTRDETSQKEDFIRNGILESGEFCLVSRRIMPDPVLALSYVDLTADGLNELVVLSLNGLHVLQHDLRQAARKLLQRISLFI